MAVHERYYLARLHSGRWGQARYYLPLLDTHPSVQVDRKMKVFKKINKNKNVNSAVYREPTRCIENRRGSRAIIYILKLLLDQMHSSCCTQLYSDLLHHN